MIYNFIFGILKHIFVRKQHKLFDLDSFCFVKILDQLFSILLGNSIWKVIKVGVVLTLIILLGISFGNHLFE